MSLHKIHDTRRRMNWHVLRLRNAAPQRDAYIKIIFLSENFTVFYI